MQNPNFEFEVFKRDGENFLQSLLDSIFQLGIPVQQYKCDHLCFRVQTLEQYGFFKSALELHGKLLTEAMVNGRPISTFRLHKPFQLKSHTVDLVELPSPKPGHTYQMGFEHAEFVIQESFSEFRSKYPGLKFHEGGNPILNPELGLKLSNGSQVKFHHLSLDRVIELEDASIKHVIFDFDGTLIKSREAIYEINRQVFSKATDREISLQEAQEKFHPEFSKLFEAFEVTCPIKQSQAHEDWGQVASQFTFELFDHAKETLENLKFEGYQLHLWTARDENSTRAILKTHDLTKFFSTLSFASVTDSKPNAKSLMFHWQTCEPNEVIVIGDSPSDVLGARNIGAIRAGALWDPYAKQSALIEHGAELCFTGLKDFNDWLTS